VTPAAPARARWALGLAGGAAGIVALALAPITRPPAFHRYADERALGGLANAGDVLSNLGFLLVALVLGRRWWRARERAAVPAPLVAAAIAGVGAIGVGSAVYHLAPSDGRLVLDVGSIALTLMMLLACVVSDRIGARAGLAIAALGAVLAVVTVLAWYAGGGTRAGGDLRWYVVLQGGGVVLPGLLVLVAPGRIARAPVVLALALFVVARALAARDAAVLDALGVSGHALKHVVAAAAAGVALRAVVDARAA
jgi:hypothetical protein